MKKRSQENGPKAEQDKERATGHGRGTKEEIYKHGIIIITIIIIHRDLKSLPVIKYSARLYNDGKKRKRNLRKIYSLCKNDLKTLNIVIRSNRKP